MGVLDGPLGSVAQVLISLFGTDAVLVRPAADAEYDAATRTVIGGEADRIPCSAVVAHYEDRQIDGTLIKAGDRRILVSRLEINVQPRQDSDVLEVGDDIWQIKKVTGYTTGDQEAAYELQGRD